MAEIRWIIAVVTMIFLAQSTGANADELTVNMESSAYGLERQWSLEEVHDGLLPLLSVRDGTGLTMSIQGTLITLEDDFYRLELVLVVRQPVDGQWKEEVLGAPHLTFRADEPASIRLESTDALGTTRFTKVEVKLTRTT